jgi:hypothetical protein
MAYTNVGKNTRVADVFTRKAIKLTINTCLHSRCCMVDLYIYKTPSLSYDGQDRVYFYNVELTYLLISLPPTMILGRFQLRPVKYRLKSVYELQQIERLVTGFGLVDV